MYDVSATTEIYTLSLHDALPISEGVVAGGVGEGRHGLKLFAQIPAGLERMIAPHPGRADLSHDGEQSYVQGRLGSAQDRKSTRLNSSHMSISYAVFCLKKKKSIL